MVGVAFITLFPLLDSGLLKGPTWGDFITNKTKNCQANGWRNLFFV